MKTSIQITSSILILSIASVILLQAQIIPGSSYERLEAFTKRKEARDTSWFSDLKSQNIGPTVFSGRVTDIAVNPNNTWEFYVAYASGGLWYTNNNGVSFTPFFQQEAVMTIGAIAVDWRQRVVWVGTGEANASRSSYAGVGVYRGTVGMDNWELMGLNESHHIGRIVLDPRNSSKVYVAAVGPLYSKSSNRGVFLTQDGGKSWSKSLYVNDSTGCIDLALSPNNPDVVYAAMWQKDRKAWNLVESGPHSGIYKSINGGKQWKLMTHDSSGFPTGPGVGRIGLDVVKKDSQTVLYALLDNFELIPQSVKADKGVLEPGDFRNMDNAAFLQLDDNALNEFLRKNRFPKKHNAKSVKAQVQSGIIQPKALADYVEDANSILLSGKVYGAELYRSDDDGVNWYKTHEKPLEGVYNSYGYYFGLVRAGNTDAKRVYIGGVPLLKSDDGGKNFKNINGENVHVDHHALWVNPKNPDHLILGNDGGINISYDGGENWAKCNSPTVGQFYTVFADLQDPFWVYGGTQDNGVWGGSHDYKHGTHWHNTGKYHYESIMGGDGMQVQVDTRNHKYLYTGYQFGNYFRIDRESKDRKYITPKHELGERPYRWNWQTPILLSSHNQDIVYMGSQFLHRSMDQGNNFTIISPDLTAGGIKGDVPYGTITCLDESTLQFGLLYTGSDDGMVHVSYDAGNTWSCISEGLPPFLYISRIQASHEKNGRVYVALNGYRNDHFKSYIYVSDDYGSSWSRIGVNLPSEPVNVIKEDPVNPDVIYVGTDHQSYVSVNAGETFMALSSDLPDAPVHDLFPHSRDDKLVIATHGRSLFTVDIGPIRKFELEKLNIEFTFECPDTMYYRNNQGNIRNIYSEPYIEKVTFESFCGMPGITTFQIISKDGATLYGDVLDLKKGYNSWNYEYEVTERGMENWMGLTGANDIEKAPFRVGDNGKMYLKPGTYDVLLRHETGYRQQQTFTLIEK